MVWLEWAATGTWMLLGIPWSVKVVGRMWRRARWKEDGTLDAVLATLVSVLVHLAIPVTIVLASPENATLDVVRVRNVLTSSEARRLVEACEAHAREEGWTTRRHRSYPTTDIPVEVLGAETRLEVEGWVQDRILPRLQAWHLPPGATTPMRDLFVVKYAGDGQRKLGKHRDGCELSFGVALSQGHKTAGTVFTSFRHWLQDVHIGELWFHPSAALHRALPVSDDETRYVLVGFVHVTPRWPRYYRTWGCWATTLREWRLDAQQPTVPALLQDGGPPRVSRLVLARRRARNLLRGIFRDVDPFGRRLLYVAAVLCALLIILCVSLAVDFVRIVLLDDDPKSKKPPRRAPGTADAVGRYSDLDVESATPSARARTRTGRLLKES